MTGNISVDASISCRPPTRTEKAHGAAANPRPVKFSGSFRKPGAALHNLQTHIPTHKQPFLPQPAALTPNQKTEEEIYTVSGSNRSFSLHSRKTQR